MRVKKHFQDKESKRYYRVGAEYKGDRVEELQKKGFLEREKTPQKTSVLNHKADEVVKLIDGMSKDEYKDLLKAEKEGKNRKTVVERIESEL